ncbi:LCP family protein [bacterium]|nr:LCP family protein [bacterium]
MPKRDQSVRPDFVYDPVHDKRHNLQRFTREKPKKPWWKKTLMAILIITLISGAWFAFFAVRNITKIAPNFFKFSQKLKGEDEGRVNILLLGVGDPGHEAAGLSDTNILVSVNTKENKVALTSIPRDTRVKIPGYGFAKINNANAYGDIPLAKQTVSNFLDEPIQYYIRTDFTGLKQAVDAVGGIEINNKDYLSDPEYPCDNNQWRSCGFTLKPGTYKADGALALKYARCRKGTCGDDFGRAARQQEVLSAIRSKAMSAGTILNPAKLTSLISAAGDNVQTDMSVGEIMRLNELTKDIPNDQFINVVLSLKENGFLKSAPDGTSDLVPVDSTLAAIQTFEDNIFAWGPIWKENPSITIQNGTAAAGIGGKLQTKFEKDKYPIAISQVTNALNKDYSTTRLFDMSLTDASSTPKSSNSSARASKPNTRSYLEGLLKVQASAPTPGVNSSSDFVIIIGSDYTNYLQIVSPAPVQ